MVENRKNSTRWQRLVALLRKTLWWQRAERNHLPPSQYPPASAVSSVNEEEIRKRLEGLGYIE